MKHKYSLLLLSLLAFSCNDHSDKDYSDLNNKYFEKINEVARKEAIIDSLKVSCAINHIEKNKNDLLLEGTKNNIQTKNKKLNDTEQNLLKNEFFKKYEYIDTIKIRPGLYFVTVSKNNVNKNFIVQLLTSVDKTSSKYIFTPTNKTILDFIEKDKKEEPTKKFRFNATPKK